jgi:hypothetical protein
MYISTKQINAVVKVLKDNEYLLSDGYKYYCRSENEIEFYDSNADKVLEKVAIDIIKSLNKIKQKGEIK